MVSRAGEHWQARVFREEFVAEGKLAEEEDRAMVGFDATSVGTVETKAAVIAVLIFAGRVHSAKNTKNDTGPCGNTIGLVRTKPR